MMMKSFILIELLIALLIMIVAIHLFFDFFGRYNTHLKMRFFLDDVSNAIEDLLTHKNIISKPFSFQTTNLTCEARLLQTTAKVVYTSIEVLDCK